MIIQCDHCSARFRMDDSKLANGPVKVRCAKCKEVFVVQPEEPAVASVVPPLPEPAPPAAGSDDSAEFSFDTPAESNEISAGAADDFSFDSETPAVSPAAAAAAQADAANEFDWQAGAAPEFDSSGTDAGFDLSSFDDSLPAQKAPAAAAVEDDNDFDFGEVDLTATSAPPVVAPPSADAAGADDFSMDFGEVSFADNTPQAGPADPLADSLVDDFPSFTTLADQSAEPSKSEDFLLSFNADAAESAAPAAADKEGFENVNFGEFSFGDMGDSPAAETAAAPAPFVPAPTGDDTAYGGFASDYPEEEPPPASLTSRKKGGSHFPLFVIAGAIALIVVLAGSGVYFFGGTKAFSKVGLGFLVDWYGGKGADEGSIALKGVTAAYTVNSTAGELFVVRGEAVNNFKKPRASVQIKVSLLGSGKTNLVTKTAYCGNSLSNEQLATLPLAKIEEIMNNQFGDSLTNLGLKPGATIPFVVVISPLPKDATDYTVVVGGSTVATQ